MRVSGIYNRVEVVDHTTADDDGKRRGRVLTKWITENLIVRFDEQDDGKTLKIFFSELGSTNYCPGCGSEGFMIGAPVSVCGECGWCE